MTAAEVAEKNFREGHSCAQAVVLAFIDKSGFDEGTARAMTLPMGGGIGRLRETCGALSGGSMALGLLFPEISKSEMYALVQRLGKAFREGAGSLNCGELLTGAGIKAETSPQVGARTEEYYRKRPCPSLVRLAASIVEEIAAERGK